MSPLQPGGGDFTPDFSKIPLYAQARRMQLPQGRASSLPQQSPVKRGMEELRCDGADSPFWKEQLGVPGCPPPALPSFTLRLYKIMLSLAQGPAERLLNSRLCFR